jgi:uncharacterized protein YfdQ (DUF2303 family)
VTPDDKTALIEAVNIGRTAAQPITTEAIHFAVIPQDHQLVSLEQYQYATFPRLKSGHVKLFDAASFCAYYDLFSDSDSRIFADPTAFSFTAVLDYHQAGDGEPRFGKHVAMFICRKSEEWMTWSNTNKKQMSQVDFADFIESNAPDIHEPPAAAMLDVARDLKAKNEVTFESGVRLSDGQQRLVYQETIRGSVGKANMDVPEQFVIRIPIFYGSAPVAITARLRYRINTGKLVFWSDLLRANQMAQEAFEATVRGIAAETSTQVLMGSVGA